MNKKTMQIDVIGAIEGTRMMKCKLYAAGHTSIILMLRDDYEFLMQKKVFVRDGRTLDSAGVINTTKVFVEI